MKIKETIGIDVSKATLDAHIHSNKCKGTFENSKKGFAQLIGWAHSNSTKPKENILFAFEHTGLYSERLTEHLSKEMIPHTVVPGLQIKKSLGIVRGKDDRIDAAKIALYAYRLRDEIKPSKAPSKQLRALKKLLSLRERLIKQRAGYRASLKEQKKVLAQKDFGLLFKVQKKMIVELTKQIRAIDAEMESIVKTDTELDRIFKLLMTIRCIGNQAAMLLLVHTEGFTKFNNARQFAAYCGIAPYPHRSGTSIRGRSRVSPMANKNIKSLLNMCAMSSILYNTEIRKYYDQRVAAGKNKMSTINIIRNKLVSRAFAVVNRGTPYVNVYKHAS
ncbi:IS110 family transposase [Flagellimonas onchidii]|uniref:IS110 family transposase n=1 Tax=Flagellimonas onchidii TaxID=2562684 RepID=UPI0010A624B4|nr:IS110 family transposase [Allomuricauda onchidii]